MSVLDALLEVSFDEAKHPRGPMGRWIAAGTRFRIPGRKGGVGEVVGPSTSDPEHYAYRRVIGYGKPEERLSSNVLRIHHRGIEPMGAQTTSPTTSSPAAAPHVAAPYDVASLGAEYDRARRQSEAVRDREIQQAQDEYQVAKRQGLSGMGNYTQRKMQAERAHRERIRGPQTRYRQAADQKFDSIEAAARAGALPSQRNKTGRPTGRKYDSIGDAARAGALPSQQPTEPVVGGIYQVQGRGSEGGMYEVTGAHGPYVQIKSKRSTGTVTTIPVEEFRQGYKLQPASSSRVRGLQQLELERRAGARRARPRIREDMMEPRPDVLGALLGPRMQEAIGPIKKGAFHAWLGKKPGEPITDADIAKGMAAGGHPAKMAHFAKQARKWK